MRDEDIYSKYKEVCIYRGREMRGRIVRTYLRGEMIYNGEERSVMEGKNCGRIIKRKEE